MMDEILKFDSPKHRASIIKVLGVGGGGSNAVSHMFRQGIKGVDFIICNTDVQAMEMSPVPNKIQLGNNGLGAGSIPEVGRQAAEEKIEDIRKVLQTNTKMLFITAGMGGGTGTGAAPVIARLAREMDILTVGIVTMPFGFEGRKRELQAKKGIEELRKFVDSLLVINNDKLREIHGNLKISEAFAKADDILTVAAKGIAELITVTGYINVDFEDVKTVMKDSGTAIMGSAVASGPDRASVAVREALSSPLLNDNSIYGAANILLYISSGKDEITFDEVTIITDYIQKEAGNNAEIIWGNGYDENLGDKISITLIATGFPSPEEINQNLLRKERNKIVYHLEDPCSNESAPKRNMQETCHSDTHDIQQEQMEPSNEISVENQEETIDQTKPDKITEITLYIKPSTDKQQQNALNSTKLPELFEKDDSDKEVVHKKEEVEISTPIASEDHPPVDNKQHALSSDKEVPASQSTSDHKPVQPGEDVDQSVMLKKASDRVEKLKSMSLISRDNFQNLEELEKIPAYIRRNVQLNNVPPSNESSVSRFTLSDDGNGGIELRSNDIPFIHNKPD